MGSTSASEPAAAWLVVEDTSASSAASTFVATGRGPFGRMVPSCIGRFQPHTLVMETCTA